MKRGDIFNTHGYCLVASIDCANEEGGGPDGPGRVLVMHNNSTHFLVALAPLASLEMAIESGTEEQIVELLASFYYSGGSQPEITAYYRQALLLAMEEALKR